MERILGDDQRGFEKHVKGTVMLGGDKSRNEYFMMDEDDTLLTD